MMNRMKKTPRTITALLTACFLAALLTACSASQQPQESGTLSPETGKQISVVVTHKDGTSKEIPITTEKDTLGRALVEAGVVEDNQTAYGLYIVTADGETADEKEEEWWCITKGGEAVATGADSTPMEDGDTFELTFTIGWS